MNSDLAVQNGKDEFKTRSEFTDESSDEEEPEDAERAFWRIFRNRAASVQQAHERAEELLTAPPRVRPRCHRRASTPTL